MLPKKTNVCVLVVVLCLVVSGCSTAKKFGKTLGSLVELREKLINKFGEPNVDIRINETTGGRTLAITFVNSPLNDRDIIERQKRAQETAIVVKDQYPESKQLRGIFVIFSRAKTTLFVFHSVVVLDVHGFDKDGKLLPGFAGRDESLEDQTRPSTIYSPSRNQTDVACVSFQLEGTPEHGVTMLPHLSLTGDIQKITPKPPKEVSFDFASFSEKPRFPNLTNIVFLTDNKVSYQTEGQFSTSKLADGMVSEFLYLKVPSRAVLKITDGKEIGIRLGKNEYELTEQQVLSMQRMADFLKE